MKRKLDFVIAEDDMTRKIFRFYPYRSHCHGYHEDPPKTWDEVYKVYYAYAILIQWKDDDGHIAFTKTLFEERCDEYSRIDTVGCVCKNLQKYKNYLDVEIFPWGDGITWKIHKVNDNDYYTIELWNDDNVGFRFFLYEKELKPFGEYLTNCCEYMLKHSEGI